MSKPITATLTQQSSRHLIKWLCTPGMVVIIGTQLVLTQWLQPTVTVPAQNISDGALLFGLLAAVLLSISISKSVLGYIAKKADNISAHTISNIYFAGGCTCFVLFLIS